MITYEIDDNSGSEVVLKIIAGECSSDAWESAFRLLSNSHKKVVFEVNCFDVDGLFLMVLKRWSHENENVFIRTSCPNIKHAVSFNLGSKAEFV